MNIQCPFCMQVFDDGKLYAKHIDEHLRGKVFANHIDGDK